MSMSTRAYNDLADFKCKIKISECEECNGDMMVWEDKTSRLSTIEYGYGQHEDYHAVCIDCGYFTTEGFEENESDEDYSS